MDWHFKKVYVEITNVCNLNCSFCPKTTRAPRYMSVDEFARVLTEIRPYTDYIYLHLMGEPFLHPALGRLLELCAERGVRVNITTNGTLIAAVRDTLLDAPALRKVGFSLHSYEANRAERTLEDYLEDIFSFVECSEDTGLIRELRLWNGDAAGREGENALNGRIIRMAEARLGVSVGRLSAERGSVKLRDRLYLGFAEIFDWPDARGGDAGSAAFCRGLRDQFGVLADGTAVPCCLDSVGTAALGNLLAAPLADMLAAPRARAIYEGFSRREAVEPLCRRCGYARRR